MKSVYSVMALSLAFSSLIACSNMQDNGLLTNEASTTTSSGVSTTPNSSNLTLVADSTSIYMNSGADQAEVTGDCFASTYPSHVIRAYRIDNSGNATLLVIRDINTGSSGQSVALCKNGRFDISIPAGSGLAAGNNNIKVTLTATDSNGAAVVNDANASRMISIIK